MFLQMDWKRGIFLLLPDRERERERERDREREREREREKEREICKEMVGREVGLGGERDRKWRENLREKRRGDGTYRVVLDIRKKKN